MSIATKHGYENIIKRLMLAGARNITDPNVPSNVTQEDCAAVKNNIEKSGTETAHTTSKFQDLHPSHVVLSSTCRSTVSADSGDGGISVHCDGILSDSAAEKLPSDRFSDLHAPSAPLAVPPSPSAIDTSCSVGGSVNASMEHIVNPSHDDTSTTPRNNKFADLHPPPDTSTIRDDLSELNSSVGDDTAPDCSGTCTIEASEIANELQSQDDEWFVVPLDVSAYPAQVSLPTKSADHDSILNVIPAVTESSFQSAPIEGTFLENNHMQDEALELKRKRKAIRIRKIAARRRRRKELHTALRATRKMHNAKEEKEFCRMHGTNQDDEKVARKRTVTEKIGHRKQKHGARRTTTDFIGKQHAQVVALSEVTILRDELKHHAVHSAQLSDRVDKLTAELQKVRSLIMAHHPDDHNQIKWDQEIEFVRNVERQVGKHLYNNTISHLYYNGVIIIYYTVGEASIGCGY